jgi:hypothetical protein
MSPQSGAASGASDQAIPLASLRSVTHDAGAASEPTAEPSRAGVAPLVSSIRSADQAAAVRAIASFGVWRDDGVWITECAWCKRVRSTAGEWRTLTAAVRGAMGAERTHGICPECARACITRAR